MPTAENVLVEAFIGSTGEKETKSASSSTNHTECTKEEGQESMEPESLEEGTMERDYGTTATAMDVDEPLLLLCGVGENDSQAMLSDFSMDSAPMSSVDFRTIFDSRGSKGSLEDRSRKGRESTQPFRYHRY